MGYTSEQQKAINATGSNILVSAGAGSGKTTVLSERVIRILLNGIDVDRLIILTFTNAAAAEMKSRIKEKIGQIETLKTQLAKLENAKISTFDSFCLGLVKQYHYLLNLPESIEIADKILLGAIKRRLLEETLDELYEEQPSWFIEVVNRFFDRGDKGLIEVFQILDKGLEMIPKADHYLNHLPEMMFNEEAIHKNIIDFENILKELLNEFITAYQSFVSETNQSNNEKVIEYRQKLQLSLQTFLKAQSLEDILNEYRNVKFPSMPKVSRAIDEETLEFMKTLVNPIKSAFEAIKKQFSNLMVSSVSELRDSFVETRPTIEAVCTILGRYREKLKSYQLKNNLFDFIDIMHLAIDLIVNHEEIREELKTKTFEIMVDEYQDTNDLQEFLVSLISRDNVFLVGDAKQSIYGFRNANPLNFIEKYHLYSQNIQGISIDLNANFRSRKETIEGINTLFNPIMSEEIGGIDYQNNQALLYGNTLYNKHSEDDFDYSPEILSYQLTKEMNESQPVYEAKIIAKKIIEMMNQKTPVAKFVNGDITYRTSRFQDFCILIDRKSYFSIFEKILTDALIPVDAIADEIIIASTEILFFSQLLKLMKCFIDLDYFKRYFRHALYGVARSFVYQIEDDDVIQLFVNHTFEKLEDIKILDSYIVFSRLYQDLLTLSSLVNDCSISLVIDKIVETTKIYEYIASLDDPASVERKLDFIFSKVRSFRQFQFDDLINYFDEVYSNHDLDIEFARPIDFSTDAVRIMTIHKSKGLEFPFCFYPGLDKSLVSQDQKQSTLFDRRYGLIIKAKNTYFYDTIVHNIVRSKKQKTDLSERIRLFYVALTRAKEKMFFLLNEEKSQSLTPVFEGNYLAMSQRLKFKRYHHFFDAVIETNMWKKTIESVEIMTLPSTIQATEVAKTLIFEPINVLATTLKSSHFSKTQPLNLLESPKQKFKQGIDVHRLFETFDFYHPQTALKSLTTTDQMMMQKFLNQDVIKSIDRGIIFQEYPFIETLNNETKMGIIDLMVIYPDHIDIIDYKLKNINDNAYVNQLKGYRQHIMTKTDKPIHLYLYSIIQNIMQLVEE